MNRIKKLLSRVYRNEAGEGGDQGMGVGTGEPIKSFADSFPPEYKDNAALRDYKDLGGLLKSHINLQSMVGNNIPMPKDENDESWNQVYDKLGRPKTPAEYQLKLADEFKDIQLDENRTKWAQDLFHKAGLNSRQANAILNEYVKLEMQQMQEADNSDKWVNQIKQEFGDKFEEKTTLAQQAVKMFGDQETRQWLTDSGLGNHPSLVKMFANIGNLLKEDKAFTEGASSNGFVADPAQAKMDIGKLNADKEFMSAYMNNEAPGHKEAVERMQRLYKVAYPNKVKS